MFSKPDCGWVTFTLGDFEAVPSYLTDVPMDCVDAFISVMENKRPVSVWFDEEGSDFLLILSECNRVFIIHNVFDEPAKLYEYNIDHRKLASEFLDDMGKYFDDFTNPYFDAFVASDEDGSIRTKQLCEKLYKLQDLVKNYRG